MLDGVALRPVVELGVAVVGEAERCGLELQAATRKPSETNRTPNKRWGIRTVDHPTVMVPRLLVPLAVALLLVLVVAGLVRVDDPSVGQDEDCGDDGADDEHPKPEVDERPVRVSVAGEVLAGFENVPARRDAGGVATTRTGFAFGAHDCCPLILLTCPSLIQDTPRTSAKRGFAIEGSLLTRGRVAQGRATNGEG